MPMPRKLKFLNLFVDGNSYAGQVEEVVLPTLERSMEDWRSGGMSAPIKVDMGLEALTCEWTCGGFMDAPFAQFGVTKHNAVALRFAGSFQAEDSDTPVAVEVNMQGRHSKIDMGTSKTGDNTTFKVTSELSYYKLVVDGKELVEIDIPNMVEKFNGTDRLEDHRKAIGAQGA